MANQTLREAIEELRDEYDVGPGATLRLAELSNILARFPKPSGPTVRVRVAVAVAPNGEWAAEGFDDQSDSDSQRTVTDCMDHLGSIRVAFVEADVLLPEAPQTVEAAEALP